jgi:N-methylhydantoinase B
MSTTANRLLDELPELRDETFWDGVQHCYIPGPELTIHPSLKLHDSVAAEIDPVTYEVVRYSLLNINLEHNALLQRLAVSQIIILSRDYQTAMLSENGEVLFVGPGVQYFANTASLCVQYTLENRSKNPGIGPGDMYLISDAYVGAPHQMDACIAAPVFVGDELFCWTTNTLHYQDVGGITPGSFVHHATDAWEEGLHWPPIKIVEGGQLREDVERLYVRQSRFPVLVGMDLRAAIAANEASRKRVSELVDRYGADVVKGVMRGTLDAGEKLLADRLKSIPDGRWSQRFYSEGAVPGDKSVYTMQVNLTKLGERLFVDNAGTDPQVGSINITFGPFAGSVLAGMMGQIVPDLAGAYGGAYRGVEFRPEPGTILCADHPAAISPTPFTAMNLINAAATATAKMLSCGNTATRELILGGSACHPGGVTAVAGFDAKGNQFHVLGGEMMLGSSGGSPTRDGMDFAGHWWIPSGIGPNVEDLEAGTPMIYLYRRALEEGLDGAGQHRGGLGFVYGMALRDAGGVVLFSTGESFPKGDGLMGADPGSRARSTLVQGGDAFEQLAEGRVPLSAAELAGDHRELPWKVTGEPVAAGDVIEGVFSSMPGYGDPLRRDPAAVAADVGERILSPSVAERVYGVILHDGHVDADATNTARLAARRTRIDREPGELVEPPSGAQRVGELLYVVDRRWWCNGADLGPVDSNYKSRAKLRETSIRALGPEFDAPDEEVADLIVFREFLCPVTGYRIDTELALRTEPLLHDIQIQL